MVWVLYQTWLDFETHRGGQMGAALAYYTMFSVAPILGIAIGVSSIVFGAEAAQHQVSMQLSGLLGPDAAKAVESLLADSHRQNTGVVATIVGSVALLLGATSAFSQLRSALNTIWGVLPMPDAPRGEGLRSVVRQALRSQFLSFAMVLVVGFLLLVSLGLSAALSGVGAWLGGLTSLGATPILLGDALVSQLVFTLLFAMIFKVLPDVQIPWSDVMFGAFSTAALFSVGKLVIGLYLGNSAIASAYGAAGSLAVFLVWVYYSAQILLLGAEFTRVSADARQADRTG